LLCFAAQASGQPAAQGYSTQKIVLCGTTYRNE
jgi:hypothetical protein